MREYIDGAAFAEMILCATAALELKKQQINELNVFPVPDGDTGTNMSLTMGAAAAELRKRVPETVGKAADVTASALLRGARGNSGVILSLLFRGLARSVREKDRIGGEELAAALSEGVGAAYKAVMKPAEGTILTVSRLSAEHATVKAREGAGAEAVLDDALAAARIALENTVNQNPVLKKAGVIDAGGKGYVTILEAMLASLRGEFQAAVGEPTAETKEKADFSEFATEDIHFTYCTEFIVSRENLKDPEVMREFLNGLGDSLVLVDDDELIKVHVHTNAPGSVLTEALTYGSLVTVKVENMRNQHTETLEREAAERGQAESKEAPAEKPFGIVSVCAGPGMEAVFRDLGTDGIILGGQTMNPSTEDILKEIRKTPASAVFVLPNNKNIVMAAQQCAGLTEKKVIVIPSATVPQGIAAMLSFEPSLTEQELIDNMTDALTHVHTAQVTYAARDSEYDGREIKEGDYLTILDGRLLDTAPDMGAVMDGVASALQPLSPEFLTVFYGEGVSEDSAEESADRLRGRLPNAEITLINGGQPVYSYIISAE